MPAPLVVGAAAAAARLLARKLAKDAAKKAVKKTVKTASKSKSLAEPKSAVKVKPPAKTKPAPINTAKMSDKTYKSMGRYENKQYDARFPEPQYDVGKARDMRIYNSKNPSASGKASRPAESPANPDFRYRVKINSAPKKAKAKTKSDARGLKAAQGKSLAPKNYKEGPRTKAIRTLTKAGINPKGGSTQLGKKTTKNK